MTETAVNQERTIKYYDKFSKVYDWVSSDSYYQKPRKQAIKNLELNLNQNILNIPCGTGQNFEYFQNDLKDTGNVIGIDLSAGMLSKANTKIQKNGWNNIQLFCEDATKVNVEWINKNVEEGFQFDSILCDLGLSGFPEWEKIIDNLIDMLKPNGKLVIMDWYIKKPSLRGQFIKWIGKGEVNRPLYQYMETKVKNFELNDTFKGGEVFVAAGIKK